MHSQLRSSAEESPTDQSSRARSTPTQHPPSPSVDDGATCPNCATHIETVGTSEAICPDCDIVVASEPISRAPRPQYDEDDKRSKARAGSRFTLLYADRGLGVGIATNARTDGNGGELGATQRRVFRKKKWTKHLTPQGFRLDYALGEIRRMGGDLSVPTSELERAARLYREAHDQGCLTGRSVDGFVAACLLAAMRQSSLRLPISEREIRTVSRATTEQIRTARGVLEVDLGVEVPPMEPQDFVPKASSALSAPWHVERCATTLLDAYLSDNTHRSISPRTLAAAALHAAYDLAECAERPSLEDLSQVTDVAVSTISDRKSDLMAYRDAWQPSRTVR